LAAGLRIGGGLLVLGNLVAELGSTKRAAEALSAPGKSVPDRARS
jgi:hypothetical protein